MKIFVKKCFLGLTFLTSVNSLSCISMRNQEFVGNVNGDDPVFFTFSTETSKCSGSCNNITYLSAKISVPDVVKI